MKKFTKLATISVFALALSACGSMDRQDRRIAAGAALGAAGGYLITGDATGVMAGAAAGGLVGHQYDRHQEKRNK